MTEKEKYSAWVCSVCGVLFIALVIYGILTPPSDMAGVEVVAPAVSLMSLAEIQEALGIKPDGIYGEQTKEVWNEYIENRDAATYDYFYKDGK